MLNYSKISFKYVFTLVSSFLILYLLYLIYQEKSEMNNTYAWQTFSRFYTNFKPVLKPTKTKINFITKFPDIKPEKCLKTGPYYGGNL